MNISVINAGQHRVWVYITKNREDRNIYCLASGKEYQVYLANTNISATTFHSVREAVGQIKKFFKVKPIYGFAAYDKDFEGYLKIKQQGEK